MEKTFENTTRLFDFDFIGDTHFSVDDMLEVAYLEGKNDFQKELKNQINNGLQTSAVTSSLFKEKLDDKKVCVKNMFLRILDFAEFECLVILSDKDYYEKSKRWAAYKIARELNENLDDIDIKFSLMPFSDKIESNKISSEGFYFKYAK